MKIDIGGSIKLRLFVLMKVGSIVLILLSWAVQTIAWQDLTEEKNEFYNIMLGRDVEETIANTWYSTLLTTKFGETLDKEYKTHAQGVLMYRQGCLKSSALIAKKANYSSNKISFLDGVMIDFRNDWDGTPSIWFCCKKHLRLNMNV